MDTLWLKDFPAPPPPAMVAALPRIGVTLWQAVEGAWCRAYLQADVAPDSSWTRLIGLLGLAGASAGQPAACHYVVETDVAPEHDEELNAWYTQQHLPGLAAVPGTVRAWRYRRVAGSPVYLAGYDLVTPDTLGRPEWLAVRHTDWSARVRPLFQNTRRTLFKPLAPSA